MTSHDELIAEALRHHAAGRLHEAEGLYRRVLAADPRHADALHLLGLVAHQVGQSEGAVQLISEAIRYGGDVPVYHNNLGEAYRTLGRFADATACYRRAIALDGRFAEAHNNLGTVYQNQGLIDDALACYDAAIALEPDYVNAHYNRARARLTASDFARGWEEYEWRWRRPEFGRLPLAEPQWDGTPLAGRTLLVRWEQGLGDTLQFVRYLKVLENAGQRVIAMVQPALVGLLAESGFQNLLPPGAPLPPFDVHAMLMSLPHLLGTTLETIPATVPYLWVPATETQRWKHELRTADHFNVGIAWQGNPQNPNDRFRSIPLDCFTPLAGISGIRLFSLQVGPGREQLAVTPLAATTDLADRIADFRDTAAIATALDLIVTCDSAVAHLAGALGVDAWVALPVSADFRWLQNRSDSPWYPTMRLFRQRALGDWSSVFTEIAAALVERMKLAG